MPQSTPFDQFSHATRKGWFSGVAFVLRVALGVLFLSAAWSKISADAWSASSYLAGATGPFAMWFQSLAGNLFVDGLNMYGQFAIGLALVVGILVRPAAFFGAVMMILYYFAHFTQNTAHGFVDEHVLYAVVFALFACGGFGYIFGLDGVIGRQPSLQKKKWARFLFG